MEDERNVEEVLDIVCEVLEEIALEYGMKHVSACAIIDNEVYSYAFCTENDVAVTRIRGREKN